MSRGVIDEVEDLSPCSSTFLTVALSSRIVQGEELYISRQYYQCFSTIWSHVPRTVRPTMIHFIIMTTLNMNWRAKRWKGLSKDRVYYFKPKNLE